MKYIEIVVRTGDRSVFSDGRIEWIGKKEQDYLVTYGEDDAAAIKEALLQTRRLLERMLAE